MPFKKVGTNNYTSPSGRHFNGAQVRLYYANGGKFPGEKGKGDMGSGKGFAKGGDVRVASYAQGGPVLGRTEDWMKSENRFTGQTPPPAPKRFDNWGKGSGSSLAKRSGDKSEAPIKPRK